MQATEEDNRMLRFCLSCMELQLRHAIAAADPASSTSSRISTPTNDTPGPITAGPPAAAYPGTGGASAGAPDQSSSQVRDPRSSAQVLIPGSPAVDSTVSVP